LGRHIAGIVAAAIACFCTWYVYAVMGRKVGVTEQDLAAPLTAFVTACGGLAMAVFNALWYYFYDREDLKAWRDQRRVNAGPQLNTLLDRIKRERRNFDELLEGKPPFGKHTEVTPFELLEKALTPISDLSSYRGLVKKLLAEIARVQEMPLGKKNLARFMPLVEQLEKKLEHDVKGYPQPKK
jgi:hypothetical protein